MGGEALESLLLKGIVIGILFGIPVGVVGTLTTQRILVYGPKAGIISGLGSSSADCLYTCVSVFGLTFVSDMLIKNQLIFNIVGGIFIFLLGVKMILKRTASVITKNEKANTLKIFLSSFLVGITNPAAVLTFLFAFSYFQIPGKLNLIDGIQIIIGVFLGTLLWWVLLAVIIGILKSKGKGNSIYSINRIFGFLLVLFSVTVVMNGIY